MFYSDHLIRNDHRLAGTRTLNRHDPFYKEAGKRRRQSFDVAGFFQSEQTAFADFDGRYRLGFNFQNLGPKINYDANVSDINANFLPAQMKLGGSFDFIFDDYNKITTSLV